MSVYAMKKPVLSVATNLPVVGIVRPPPEPFRPLKLHKGSSPAKSTFSTPECQRGSFPNPQKSQRFPATNFSLQRLGEVHRKTAGRPVPPPFPITWINAA